MKYTTYYLSLRLFLLSFGLTASENNLILPKSDEKINMINRSSSQFQEFKKRLAALQKEFDNQANTTTNTVKIEQLTLQYQILANKEYKNFCSQTPLD